MATSEIDAIRARLAARPRPTDLAARRARLDGFGADYALPPDVRVEPTEAGACRRNGPSTPAADPARVLVFLHGGGYVSGSLASHRHMVAEAGRQAGARTLALAYRLAPEHPFPAALEDALAGYRHLLGLGLAPGSIALGGESAGGGLALATCREPARRRRAVARLPLVQLALGRSRPHGREPDHQGRARSPDPPGLPRGTRGRPTCRAPIRGTPWSRPSTPTSRACRRR